MFEFIKDIFQHRKDKWIVNKQALEYLNYKINWRRPQTYNDHINILKVSPKSKNLWIYTDKLEVRKFVKKTIGVKYLNKLYGVYQSPDEINLNSLPNQFVLKATHGSGFNLICNNKIDLDWAKVKNKLNKWLNIDYYSLYREVSYRLIKPQIICEKYLTDKRTQEIDYKFFCWHGQPYFIQVDIDRFSKNRRLDFYSLGWQKLPFSLRYPRSDKIILPPPNLSQMADLASALSAKFDHVRVDFYNVNRRVYFGEMTFTPNCGFFDFKPDKYNYIIGQYF